MNQEIVDVDVTTDADVAMDVEQETSQDVETAKYYSS